MLQTASMYVFFFIQFLHYDANSRFQALQQCDSLLAALGREEDRLHVQESLKLLETLT